MARPKRGRVKGPVPEAVVLDAQGLSKGAGDPRLRAEMAVANELGATVHVSVVTLTEVLRGTPRDAKVNAFLKGIRKEPVSETLGRGAGKLLGATGSRETIDAIVAVTAESLGKPVRILTGDPEDLRALTEHMPAVRVARV